MLGKIIKEIWREKVKLVRQKMNSGSSYNLKEKVVKITMNSLP